MADKLPGRSDIVDEPLSKGYVTGVSALDRFKTKVVTRCLSTNTMLIDIGSGSGKFLYHNLALFQEYGGVETTSACVAFSRNELGLKNIHRNISSVRGKPFSMVTFWHSMEHVPYEGLSAIFKAIRKRAGRDVVVVVCVPNVDSFMHFLFGKRWAYYKCLDHVHQFSARSLDLCMANFGFAKKASYYSFVYEEFGFFQSVKNVLNRAHNLLYRKQKRRQDPSASAWVRRVVLFCKPLLAAALLLPALAFCLVTRIVKSRSAVLTVCYQELEA